MTQHHRINAAGIKGEWFAVSGFIRTPTLDQAAVKQQMLPAHRDQVTGTRHFTRCTKKLNTHGHNTFLRLVRLRFTVSGIIRKEASQYYVNKDRPMLTWINTLSAQPYRPALWSTGIIAFETTEQQIQHASKYRFLTRIGRRRSAEN
jgi:hypothetical protein